MSARTGADPEDLDASVDVLEVRGEWSHAAGGGYALCSVRLGAGPAAAGLLAELFASALPGRG